MGFCHVKDSYFQSTLDRIGAKPPVDRCYGCRQVLSLLIFIFLIFQEKIWWHPAQDLLGGAGRGPLGADLFFRD